MLTRTADTGEKASLIGSPQNSNSVDESFFGALYRREEKSAGYDRVRVRLANTDAAAVAMPRACHHDVGLHSFILL